ncbi:MAG: hypothetical protein ACK4J3_19305 [Acinetobacter pittii]
MGTGLQAASCGRARVPGLAVAVTPRRHQVQVHAMHVLRVGVCDDVDHPMGVCQLDAPLV